MLRTNITYMAKNAKIHKELTPKQRAIVGARELKEYLYAKRASLTHEEIGNLVNDLSEKVYEMAYKMGWEERELIAKQRKSDIHLRIVEYFNAFYDKYGGKLPVELLEEIYYLYEIATLRRYYNSDVPIELQVNNREKY